mmetsp:Transcript_36165/g.83364  ORF Transcript_36165/g.83364 Transcript_36165/m.83364 type:complete len:448 (+) Transcript_36165:61-1404(+)
MTGKDESTLSTPSLPRWSPQESVASSYSSERSSSARLPLDEPLLEQQSPETSPRLRVKPQTAVGLVLTAVLFVAGVVQVPLASQPPPSAKKSEALPPPRIWDPNFPSEFDAEPTAKSVIRKFDGYNMARGGRDDGRTFDANVALYMAPDLLYESVGFGTWKTPHGWAQGEESNYGAAFPQTVFTQMLFFGDSEVATTTTYGTALWKGDMFGVKGPNKWVTLRITDFYYIPKDSSERHRIRYNFMMIDWADALRQIGRPVLLPSALEEGVVLPPSANDGVPAPLTVLVQAEGRDAGNALKLARAALHEDWSGEGSVAQHWHKEMTFYGPGGIGMARGVHTYEDHVLGPFRMAFVNRSVEELYSCCEGNYCAALSRIHGAGVSNWLGIPTAGKAVAIRAAMHWRTDGSKVKEGWMMVDFPGLFEQVGLDFYGMGAKGQSLKALDKVRLV